MKPDFETDDIIGWLILIPLILFLWVGVFSMIGAILMAVYS